MVQRIRVKAYLRRRNPTANPRRGHRLPKRSKSTGRFLKS